MEECKGKKKKEKTFREIACLARTSKVTHYIRTAFLKVCCIWCIRTRTILWKFSRRSLENFTSSQKKKKTVTFNDSILGIYGSNVNDFKALPHAFPSRWFNPTFACPWRAENVPFPGRKMNRIDFLTVATNFRFLFDFYWHSLLMITQFFGKIINDGFF